MLLLGKFRDATYITSLYFINKKLKLQIQKIVCKFSLRLQHKYCMTSYKQGYHGSD